MQLIVLAALVREDIREYRLDPNISPRNPGLRHLIMVAANGGVIPQKNRKFTAMLKRKGLLVWDTPSALKNYYLHNFPKENEEETMKIQFPWWNTSSDEEQKLFIRHFKILCSLGKYPSTTIPFVRDVCIKILEAMESGQGETEPNMELVHAAEQRGYRRSSIELIINNAWSKFTTPASINEAAEYINMSTRQTYRIIFDLQAKNGDIYKINHEWQVPMVVLDDWLLKRGKVTL